MIGFRGALRYTQEPEVFRARVERDRPGVGRRTYELPRDAPVRPHARELERCRTLVAEAGLLDRPGFELWVMAEVPSVLFNLERYAALGVAGISIGSNDLTQLLLGADRDSSALSETFDERDPAVTEYLRQLIPRARAAGLQTSICGQAPSVHPEYAELLVRAGIDAISVTDARHPNSAQRDRARSTPWPRSSVGVSTQQTTAFAGRVCPARPRLTRESCRLQPDPADLGVARLKVATLTASAIRAAGGAAGPTRGGPPPQNPDS